MLSDNFRGKSEEYLVACFRILYSEALLEIKSSQLFSSIKHRKFPEGVTAKASTDFRDSSPLVRSAFVFTSSKSITGVFDPARVHKYCFFLCGEHALCRSQIIVDT